MEMRQISIQQHECNVAIMVQISITKHKIFLEFEMLIISELYNGWVFGNFENMKIQRTSFGKSQTLET